MAGSTGRTSSANIPSNRTSKFLDPLALARLANIKLIAQSVVEGFISGLHRSPFKGFSVEFAEYRQYMPGDDLKHFDWKLYARTEKEYIKQYQEETNLRVHILLDCSASMGFKSTGLSKMEYGSFLAASLAYMAIRQQDSCGLVVFDDQMRTNIAPRSNPQHLKDILKVLESVKTTGKTNIAQTLHKMAESIVKRGLIVIISDLYDDPEAIMKGIHHFRHKRHEVLLFHLMDPAELEFPYEDMVELVDLETAEKMNVNPVAVREEYLKKIEGFIGRFKNECSKSDVQYLLFNTEIPFEIALANYLAKRAQLG
ncbi:MAG: DUF58 domain-containing protein [Candidatus Brocadiia bacterium]